MANGAQSGPAASDAQQTIVFEKVSLGFGGQPALEEISFTLDHGETKILLGISGSGKTLILKLALGLIKPDSGRIYVLGHEITQLKEEDLFELRRMMGMVFQESALFDSLTVEENVAFRLYEEHIAYPEIRRSRNRGAAVRGAGRHSWTVPFRAFRRDAATSRHSARNHHRTACAALRFANRRTRSGHLNHDH